MIRNWSQNFRSGNPIYQLNMLASVTIESVEERFVEQVSSQEAIQGLDEFLRKVGRESKQ